MRKHIPLIVAFVLIAAFTALIGWGNDRASCIRNNDLRSALTISFQGQVDRASQRAISEPNIKLEQLDDQAIESAYRSIQDIRPLQCDTLLPSIR